MFNLSKKIPIKAELITDGKYYAVKVGELFLDLEYPGYMWKYDSSHQKSCWKEDQELALCMLRRYNASHGVK